MAIKIEKQLKRRGDQRSNATTGSSWKSNAAKREEKPAVNKPKVEFKLDLTNRGKQGKTEPSFSRNRDIVYFKCQGRGHISSQCSNQITMLLLDNGELETEAEDSDTDFMPPLEEIDDWEVAMDGEMLVTRRALSAQVKEESLEQRENLFHTRCLVQGKICYMVIDCGSCTNVASTTIVEKLGLSTTKHP